jgi:hypothetical protein
MARSAPAAVLLAVILALGSGFFGSGQAQDFPYMVPEAPEFDDRGNPLVPSDVDSSSSMRHGKRGASFQSGADRPDPDRQADYRAVRPYVPQATGPRAAAVAPSDRPIELSAPPQAPYSTPVTTAPEPRAPKPRRSARQQPVAEQPVQQSPEQAPGMAPGQLDCSRFPQLIAQAPNPGEMQLLAREYLTCLMRSGWTQEMATKHVIGTIQTAYKLTR